MASASRFSSLSPTVTSASLTSVSRANIQGGTFNISVKQRKPTESEFVFAQREAAVMDKRKDFTLCVLNTNSPYCILACVGSLSACCWTGSESEFVFYYVRSFTSVLSFLPFYM